MDYGKFLYEKSKSSKEQKKKQKVIQVKEIKFRPGTDEGDYQVKLRSLIRFLEDGDKAKITLRFRGREMAHQQIGMEVLNRVKDDLVELAVVESFPTKIEGRQMIMVLALRRNSKAIKKHFRWASAHWFCSPLFRLLTMRSGSY